jgi:SAM-dependent methyltransferase
MRDRKLMVRLRELIRRLLRVLDYQSNRDCEYNFCRRHIVGKGAKVLDVGGTGSLLPLLLAKRGFKVTVYDSRLYREHHLNITAVRGDFLRNSLPNSAFDYVVMVSTIEHIGLGSYGAPVHEDGDLRAMSEAERILKPGGKVVLTFPFTGKLKVIPGSERWYDLNRVRRLFSGLHILAEEYYIPDRKLFGRWVSFAPCSLEEIRHVEERFGCQGCACYVVSPRPVAHLQQTPDAKNARRAK